jgi:hypothetical protein
MEEGDSIYVMVEQHGEEEEETEKTLAVQAPRAESGRGLLQGLKEVYEGYTWTSTPSTTATPARSLDAESDGENSSETDSLACSCPGLTTEDESKLNAPKPSSAERTLAVASGAAFPAESDLEAEEGQIPPELKQMPLKRTVSEILLELGRTASRAGPTTTTESAKARLEKLTESFAVVDPALTHAQEEEKEEAQSVGAAAEPKKVFTPKATAAGRGGCLQLTVTVTTEDGVTTTVTAEDGLTTIVTSDALGGSTTVQTALGATITTSAAKITVSTRTARASAADSDEGGEDELAGSAYAMSLSVAHTQAVAEVRHPPPPVRARAPTDVCRSGFRTLITVMLLLAAQAATWAFATLGTPAPQLFDVIARESEQRIGCVNPHDLANTPCAEGKGVRKAPLAGFIQFSKDQRETVKEANPGITFGQLGKKLGEMWRALDDDETTKYI